MFLRRTPCYPLHESCSLGLFFNPDDGGDSPFETSTDIQASVISQNITTAAVQTSNPKYSRLSIIRAWFNRFAAQPRQCIFKEKILFSVSITFV
jgi:hypothetical protein